MLALSAITGVAVADTAVTTPVDGAAFACDLVAPSTFAVSGTASTESSVDLRGARSFGGSWSYSDVLSGGADVPVDGGAWSAPVVLVTFNASPCRLVALPAGVAVPVGAPDPAYSGPRVRFAVTEPLTIGNGENAAKRADVAADLGGTAALTFLSSAGGEGVDDTFLLGPEPSTGATVFTGSNAIPRFDPQSPALSGDTELLGLRVDGANALTGTSWSDAGGKMSPFVDYDDIPTVAASASVASDGSLVVDEHDTVRACPSGTTLLPLGDFSCSQNAEYVVDPGVGLDVTTTVSPSGSVVRRDWAIGSTDGATHAVDLVVAHGVAGAGRVWRLPGGSYQPRAAGEVVTSALPASGPFTVAARTSGAPDPTPPTASARSPSAPSPPTCASRATVCSTRPTTSPSPPPAPPTSPLRSRPTTARLRSTATPMLRRSRWLMGRAVGAGRAMACPGVAAARAVAGPEAVPAAARRADAGRAAPGRTAPGRTAPGRTAPDRAEAGQPDASPAVAAPDPASSRPARAPHHGQRRPRSASFT
ncbi:MAG TPA: hypothetical protein VGM91_11290 [Conexibacter sp.]|jgi:hypothetical protein